MKNTGAGILEAISTAHEFNRIIDELKKDSDYYPQILIRKYKNHNPNFSSNETIYASTLVRIEREGVWYKVHCVENITPEREIDEHNLLLRMMRSVYQIQWLYQIQTVKISGKFLQEIDESQESEIERLSRIYK